MNLDLLRKAFTVAVLVLLVGAAGTASAAEDAAEGKRRFERGEALFLEGRYLDAAREFEAGYAAAPRPLFLLNIGHSYRRAGELAKARNAYKLLLRLQPNLPQRAEVEGYVKSIDDAIGPELPEGVSRPTESPRTATPGPTTQDPPRNVMPTPASAAAASEVDSSPPTSIVETSSGMRDEPEASGSVFRKTWFWVVVGTVVAGAATAAIIALRPESKSCPTNYYCIKETP